MENKLAELIEKRDYYQQEVEDLHIYEPNEEYYIMRRYDLEYEISILDNEIILLKEEIKEFNRFNTIAILAMIGLVIMTFTYMIYVF
jgi:hypothetical protein